MKKTFKKHIAGGKNVRLKNSEGLPTDRGVVMWRDGEYYTILLIEDGIMVERYLNEIEERR